MSTSITGKTIPELTLLFSAFPDDYMVIYHGGETMKIYFSSVTSASTATTVSLTTSAITTSAETLTFDYDYYGVSYSGDVDLTLPSPLSNTGKILIIKDEGGNAGTNRIRLTTPVNTIDGEPFVDMNIDFISLTLVARNNRYFII